MRKQKHSRSTELVLTMLKVQLIENYGRPRRTSMKTWTGLISKARYNSLSVVTCACIYFRCGCCRPEFTMVITLILNSLLLHFCNTLLAKTVQKKWESQPKKVQKASLRIINYTVPLVCKQLLWAQTVVVSNFHLVQSSSELLPAPENSSRIFWKTSDVRVNPLCLWKYIISSHGVTSAFWELFSPDLEQLVLYK